MTTDLPVHFSSLKKIALSPMHYLAAVREEFADTRAMRVGKVVHELVLGHHATRPLVRYPGKERKGGEWKEFEAAHAGAEVITSPEWDDALPIAEAVMNDPVAAELLKGCRREVPMEWTDGDVVCATDGVDFVNVDARYYGDLKTTTCTEPAAFSRHAARLLYHVQLEWVGGGLRANMFKTDGGAFLLGVESSPPYAVTVLRMTTEALDLGRRSIALWLERLRACRTNDHWPGYTQSIVDFELPPWLGDSDMELIDA